MVFALLDVLHARRYANDDEDRYGRAADQHGPVE
jgi:hypothetical protein